MIFKIFIKNKKYQKKIIFFISFLPSLILALFFLEFLLSLYQNFIFLLHFFTQVLSELQIFYLIQI